MKQSSTVTTHGATKHEPNIIMKNNLLKNIL